jgi:hypothetical protein
MVETIMITIAGGILLAILALYLVAGAIGFVGLICSVGGRDSGVQLECCECCGSYGTALISYPQTIRCDGCRNEWQRGDQTRLWY